MFYTHYKAPPQRLFLHVWSVYSTSPHLLKVRHVCVVILETLSTQCFSQRIRVRKVNELILTVMYIARIKSKRYLVYFRYQISFSFLFTTGDLQFHVGVNGNHYTRVFWILCCQFWFRCTVEFFLKTMMYVMHDLTPKILRNELV